MRDISMAFTTEEISKELGLVGKRLKFQIHDKSLAGDSYPFGMEPVPVEITGEYECFLTAKVLPHFNNMSMSMLESDEYTISIDKFNLKTNRVSLKEM